MDGTHSSHTSANAYVTESTGEVGSPQCVRKESGSLRSRPQCPSMCHVTTEKERERQQERKRGRREERVRESGTSDHAHVLTCGRRPSRPRPNGALRLSRVRAEQGRTRNQTPMLEAGRSGQTSMTRPPLSTTRCQERTGSWSWKRSPHGDSKFVSCTRHEHIRSSSTLHPTFARSGCRGQPQVDAFKTPQPLYHPTRSPHPPPNRQSCVGSHARRTRRPG